MTWQTVKLGDICQIKTGKLDANASSDNGIYPFFTCAREPLKIHNYAYDCECVLVAGNGDLNVKYYNGKFNAYQRTYIIALTATAFSKASVRFIYYFLDKYLEKLREQSIGGIIKYIKLANLTEAKIPLPPLAVQKRIASLLDAADELRKQRKQNIAMLDELLQATFLEMFGDPVTNPKGWEIVNLDKLGNLDRGVSKHRPRNAPHLLGGKYPLIQTGDVANSNGFIKSYSSTYSEDGLKQSKMWAKGTLCITIAANIAKTGILEFNACFPDSIVGFTSHSYARNIFVQGLFWFFQDILEKKAPQSAQKNINLTILRRFPVPFAPDNLQTQFAKIVEKVEAQKAVQQAHLAELDTLFASLQQRLFSGAL